MKIPYYYKAAQEMLHIKTLKKEQLKPIESILEGQDTLVIAPTSAGKSAIFQISGLLQEGLVLVIEPTISLMYDQVGKLKSLGIQAETINSSLSKKERQEVMKKLSAGGLSFLYLTPESLQNRSLQVALQKQIVSMLVVDECHCVTTWGHSFRDCYLKIGEFLNDLPSRPVVVALTATANSDERKQIAKVLSMKKEQVFINSLQRKSLIFLKKGFSSDEQKAKELEKVLKKGEFHSCIVYCNTKKMTDAVYKQVRAWYPEDVVKCHCNLVGEERKRGEAAFLSGDKRIMVATSAFGMGVDKADVDLVIHFNLPLSLVDYYQQAGRAGRNGEKAHCILFDSPRDYRTNRFILESTRGKNQAQSLRALEEMKDYAESDQCLTKVLLLSLGDTVEKACGYCTNCQKRRKMTDEG